MFVANYVYILLEILIYGSIFNSQLCEAQSQEYVDIVCMPLQQCAVATKLISTRPYHKETIEFLRSSFCGYDRWHRQLIFCPELKPCVANNGLIGVYTSRDNCHTLPRNNLINNAIICCPNTISQNNNYYEMSTVPSVNNHTTVVTEMTSNFEQTLTQSTTEVTNISQVEMNITNPNNEMNISGLLNSTDKVPFLNVEVETSTKNMSGNWTQVVDVTEVSTDDPEETTIFNFQAYLEYALAKEEERNKRKTKICGRRERRFKIEVAGGTISDFFEFPWMTILQFNGSAGNKNGCGGTLVSNRYVLTAAHCVDPNLLNEKNLGTLNQVILGEYDLRNETDCYHDEVNNKTTCADPPMKYDVESVIVHEGYNRESGENDIALIRLVKNVIFSDFIQPICLPTKDQSVDPSDNFTIAGWGRTPEAKFTPILLKAQIYRTEIENCSQYNVTVKDSQVCTGRGEDGNSCTGDSGGPLMIRKYEEEGGVFISYQYGIISYGFDKCATNSNSVNTYLPYYVDWILDKIEEQ